MSGIACRCANDQDHVRPDVLADGFPDITLCGVRIHLDDVPSGRFCQNHLLPTFLGRIQGDFLLYLALSMTMMALVSLRASSESSSFCIQCTNYSWLSIVACFSSPVLCRFRPSKVLPSTEDSDITLHHCSNTTYLHNRSTS